MSLPLNRARRLRRDVIDNAVHAFDFIDDAGGDGLQHFVRQGDPVGGHSIFRAYGADGAGVSVGPHIAHDADRHHWQQVGKRLPDFGIEPGFFDFGYDDIVALARQGKAVGRDFSEDAHGEARAGKRLALQDFVRHAEVAADFANFVFKQIFQRLDELEFHFIGQAADIVVRLDDLRRPAHRARLDHIGIKRTLHQPLDLAFGFFDAERFFFENFNELVADALALFFRIADAFELTKNPRGAIDGIEMQSELVAERLLSFFKFVLAQHAVVDEDAGQARLAFGVAHCAIDQDCSDRGIHTAGERADGAAGADLLLDLRDRRLNEVLWGPDGLRVTDLKDKILENLRALRRVVYLWVKLHRVPFLRDILNARDCVMRLCHQLEAGRQFESFVAMRHPDGKFSGQALEEDRVGDDFDLGVPVLALVGGTNLAPERVHHELESVADTQHG